MRDLALVGYIALRDPRLSEFMFTSTNGIYIKGTYPLSLSIWMDGLKRSVSLDGEMSVSLGDKCLFHWVINVCFMGSRVPGANKRPTSNRHSKKA